MKCQGFVCSQWAQHQSFLVSDQAERQFDFDSWQSKLYNSKKLTVVVVGSCVVVTSTDWVVTSGITEVAFQQPSCSMRQQYSAVSWGHLPVWCQLLQQYVILFADQVCLQLPTF